MPIAGLMTGGAPDGHFTGRSKARMSLPAPMDGVNIFVPDPSESSSVHPHEYTFMDLNTSPPLFTREYCAQRKCPGNLIYVKMRNGILITCKSGKFTENSLPL
jgi:hypothetical protein